MMKYIIFETAEGTEFPVIFPVWGTHDEIRNKFPKNWNVISAGKIKLDILYNSSGSVGLKIPFNHDITLKDFDILNKVIKFGM